MISLNSFGKDFIDKALSAIINKIVTDERIKQFLISNIANKIPASLLNNSTVQQAMNSLLGNGEINQLLSQTIEDKIPAGLLKNAKVKNITDGILKNERVQQFIVGTLKESLAAKEQTPANAQISANAQTPKRKVIVKHVVKQIPAIVANQKSNTNNASTPVKPQVTVKPAPAAVKASKAQPAKAPAQPKVMVVQPAKVSTPQPIEEVEAYAETEVVEVKAQENTPSSNADLMNSLTEVATSAKNFMDSISSGKGVKDLAVLGTVAAKANPPMMALSAIAGLASEYGNMQIVTEQEKTKRAQIEADKEMVLARINSCKELFMTYMEKSFDERKENFAEYFKVVDFALENNNMQALQAGLQSINQLAAQSPFKGLADMNLLTQTMSSDDEVLDI